MDDWEEYLRSQWSGKFVQYYRCRTLSLLNKENVDEDGNRIVMPPSALERLGSLEVEYPMMFQIQNATTQKASHCSVLEFVAEEGFVHIPAWMMAHLGLEENDLVLMRNTSLPKGTFVKLQPHTMDFHRVSHPGELLEYNFGKYPCMTVGETITVTEFDKRYYLDVVEARPANAVATLETDCEVEFATPLDYKEPAAPTPPETAASQGDEQLDEQPAVRFAGIGMRMDGEPVEQQQTPADTSVAPALAVSSVKEKKQVLRFGGVSAAAGGKGKEKKVGDDGGDKEPAERFAGKKYSLSDPMEE